MGEGSEAALPLGRRQVFVFHLEGRPGAEAGTATRQAGLLRRAGLTATPAQLVCGCVCFRPRIIVGERRTPWQRRTPWLGQI
jgi:hypothetical protein